MNWADIAFSTHAEPPKGSRIRRLAERGVVTCVTVSEKSRGDVAQFPRIPAASTFRFWRAKAANDHTPQQEISPMR